MTAGLGAVILCTMKYDLIELDGELQDPPKCETCLDTGVVEDGYDVRSTTFCDCPEGEEAFIGYADGEMSSGSYYDPQYDGWD